MNGDSRAINKSFCFFFQKEVLFFFEKKNQKTFVNLAWSFLSGAYGVVQVGSAKVPVLR